MVFITVVAIALVVLIIKSVNIVRVWLENAYSRPFWLFWGKNWVK